MLDESPWKSDSSLRSYNLSQLPVPALLIYDNTQPDPLRTPGFVAVVSIDVLRSSLENILGDASVSEFREPGFLVAAETSEALEVLRRIEVSTSASLGLAATYSELMGAAYAVPTTASLRLERDWNTFAGFKHTVWSLPHARVSALEFFENMLRQNSSVSFAIVISGDAATLAESTSIAIWAKASKRGSNDELVDPSGYDAMKARLVLEMETFEEFLEAPGKTLFSLLSQPSTPAGRRAIYLSRQLGTIEAAFNDSRVESISTQALAGLFLAYVGSLGSYYDIPHRIRFARRLYADLPAESATIDPALRARLAFELARASEFSLARAAVLSLTEDATAREALDLHARTDLGAALATIVYLRDDAPPQKGAATLAVTEALRAAEGTADRAAYWSIYAETLGME